MYVYNSHCHIADIIIMRITIVLCMQDMLLDLKCKLKFDIILRFTATHCITIINWVKETKNKKTNVKFCYKVYNVTTNILGLILL